MSSLNLLRWGGLATLLGAVLLVIVGLAQPVLNVFLLGAGGINEAVAGVLYVRAGFELLGRVLVMLGLVGLYVRQSEATGLLGLVGFLIVFLGTAAPMGLGLAAALATLGWALFGIASLQARIYPRTAVVLLIIGTVVGVVFDYLLAVPAVGNSGSTLMFAGEGTEIIRNVAVAWLGYVLFSGRGLAVERPGL